MARKIFIRRSVHHVAGEFVLLRVLLPLAVGRRQPCITVPVRLARVQSTAKGKECGGLRKWAVLSRNNTVESLLSIRYQEWK